MSTETLPDGTIIYVDWSEGGTVSIKCSCGNDELWISRGESITTCPCGKEYQADLCYSVDIAINGKFTVTI